MCHSQCLQSKPGLPAIDHPVGNIAPLYLKAVCFLDMHNAFYFLDFFLVTQLTATKILIFCNHFAWWQLFLSVRMILLVSLDTLIGNKIYIIIFIIPKIFTLFHGIIILFNHDEADDLL